MTERPRLLTAGGGERVYGLTVDRGAWAHSEQARQRARSAFLRLHRRLAARDDVLDFERRWDARVVFADAYSDRAQVNVVLPCRPLSQRHRGAVPR